MSSRSSIYRKRALDKLASPEDLDRLLRVTRPGTWLVLGAFGLVLGAALAWGIFGRITTRLELAGTLTLSNPVTLVTAQDTGYVSQLDVESGDVVFSDQVMAYITTPAGPVEVRSPVPGRVLARRVTVGTPVEPDMPLLSLEVFDSEGQQRNVVTYATLAERQQLETGMSADILPATVASERYGYLQGTVRTIGEYAATPEEIRAVLGENAAVEALMARSPVFEVRIALDTEADGTLAWTASDGPPEDLLSGTPCQIRIAVERERPISRVVDQG